MAGVFFPGPRTLKGGVGRRDAVDPGAGCLGEENPGGSFRIVGVDPVGNRELTGVPVGGVGENCGANVREVEAVFVRRPEVPESFVFKEGGNSPLRAKFATGIAGGGHSAGVVGAKGEANRLIQASVVFVSLSYEALTPA